ncbi:phosphotransferase [Aeromicrobium sp.]|uniref:phosphotransferase n=1 Tax=Aeromicrobium sp. TaxID=1871063 RepID=UPI0019C5C936|nr:phosphotransferase [Aeromicrobium sp.]MBC7630233.1 phosphotransferase family protein [Aeromicrobium sp.]
MADVDAVLNRIPSLAGRPRSVEELPGGLTNRNVKVTTPDGVFVVRCNRSDTRLLGIDREAESFNTRAAELAGVGAPFVEFRPELGVLIIGYIDGRTFVDADLREPGTLPRVAEACRALHSGPRFANDFDMFARQGFYLRTCVERGFPFPPDFGMFGADFARIEAALAVSPVPTVPCNNDLLAGNFVDDGDKLWLIDYEYSGNNDPFFELGNIWTECGLDDDHLAELVTSYVGHESPVLLARARLGAVTSRYGWSLWGFIQAATLDDDFDFRGWGQERFDMAVADFRSPHFDTWLSTAAGTTGGGR